jgi:hypothetical protein
MSRTKVQLAAAVVVFGGLVGAVIIQSNQNHRLRTEIVRLQAMMQARESAPAPAPATEEAASTEVMRLRGEVAKLIRERNDLTVRTRQNVSTQSQAAGPGAAPPVDPHETQRKVALARLGYARNWGTAFFLYMEKHDGQMPATFAEAIQFLPADESVAGMTPDQYEITFQGRTADLANPSATFIMRERDHLGHLQDAGISRTYLFADGHTEIVKVDDGDFTAWEQQHVPVFREPVPGQPIAGQ